LVAQAAVRSAEKALADARRSDAPPNKLRSLETSLADLKRAARARLAEAEARDRLRAGEAKSAGRVALAAVLERRAEVRRKESELTKDDLESIRFLTSGEGNYLTLNRALRSGTIAEVEVIATDSHRVTESLRKLDEYEGPVYRRLSDDLTAEQLARYQPGETIIENPYTHTTMDPGFEFGKGNVRWVYQSVTGRIVDELSSVQYEHEVTFDHFTRFLVLDKHYDQDEGCWIILMQEV